LCKILAHSICVLIQAMHAFNIHPILAAYNEREMGAVNPGL